LALNMKGRIVRPRARSELIDDVHTYCGCCHPVCQFWFLTDFKNRAQIGPQNHCDLIFWTKGTDNLIPTPRSELNRALSWFGCHSLLTRSSDPPFPTRFVRCKCCRFAPAESPLQNGPGCRFAPADSPL
ncbi:hypothetical protein Taro_051438, partial [Colocasia esculenta]|nr:hypothetical protein [Colocasia esculenta]